MDAVVAASGDFVRIDDAVSALDMPREKARRQLERWARQGWLRRAGPGVYAPVSPGLLTSERVVDDPCMLVPHLFAPAYVGGVTAAAEFWDLTEQIFQVTSVYTAKRVVKRRVERQGLRFDLRHVGENRFFGLKTSWHGQTKVQMSDIDRTIADMLDAPDFCGSIFFVNECFREYLAGGKADTGKLIEYAEKIGNGALFKRLGFLAERHPDGGPLAEAAEARLPKGNSTKLYPGMQGGRFYSRWRLWAPETWRGEP